MMPSMSLRKNYRGFTAAVAMQNSFFRFYLKWKHSLPTLRYEFSEPHESNSVS